MRFQDLTDQLLARRIRELVTEAGATVRDEGHAAAAHRRAEFTAHAARRRTAHEAELDTRWRVDDIDAAHHVIREFHGRRATAWLAEKAAISPRTARRWMRPDSVPASRVNRVIEHARHLVQERVAAPFLASEAATQAEFDASEAETAAAVEQAATEAESRAEAEAQAAGSALVAPALAGHTGAIVGIVEVAYDDDGDGYRDIGEVAIDFKPIADALADNDAELADELFGQAILDAYGDLGDTLTIADYFDGITLT